jgi:hypothetical protein
MAGQLTIDTLKASSGVLATQNGITGIAKAWVNYNGVTQVIIGSFNVSSVTRNSVGNYTINFSTAMPSATYSIAGAVSNDGTNPKTFGISGNSTVITTTSVRINSFRTTDGSSIDSTYVGCSIFGA